MSVETTYFSAITHEKVDLPADAFVVGVVRHPADWISKVVDRNVPALAPPDDLLGAYRKIEEAARDAEERNPQEIAWRNVEFENRYRRHLRKSGPKQVLSTLLEDACERPVVLVCYEADETYCHRRLLAEELRQRARETLPERISESHLADACPDGEHEIVSDGVTPHTKSCLWCGLSAQSVEWTTAGRGGVEW